MSQKKESPSARPRSLGKKFTLKKLTIKQAAFLGHYLNPKSPGYGNATRSAQLAGYKGGNNQLGVQGSRNRRNPNVREAILTALEEKGFDADVCAQILIDASLATKVQVLPNRRGKTVPVKLPDHSTRLRVLDIVCRLGGNAANCSASGPQGGVQPADFVAAQEDQKPDTTTASECSDLERTMVHSASAKISAIARLIGKDESSSATDMRAQIMQILQKEPNGESGDKS